MERTGHGQFSSGVRPVPVGSNASFRVYRVGGQAIIGYTTTYCGAKHGAGLGLRGKVFRIERGKGGMRRRIESHCL